MHFGVDLRVWHAVSPHVPTHWSGGRSIRKTHELDKIRIGSSWLLKGNRIHNGYRKANISTINICMYLCIASHPFRWMRIQRTCIDDKYLPSLMKVAYRPFFGTTPYQRVQGEERLTQNLVIGWTTVKTYSWNIGKCFQRWTTARICRCIQLQFCFGSSRNVSCFGNQRWASLIYDDITQFALPKQLGNSSNCS